MKYFSFIIGLLLCLALFSCSKPAETEVKPEPKVEVSAPRINSIIKKTDVLQETFKVIVLDAENEHPITNANVKLEWRDGKYHLLNMINKANGSYITYDKIFANKSSRLDIMVSAPGYLPKTFYRSKTNLTIKLEPCETINVSGTIFTHEGQGLPGAEVNLEPHFFYSPSSGEYLSLRTFCTETDSQGNFEIISLPACLSNLFINFICEGYPETNFTNDYFDSLDGDVELDLYLPQFLEIKGQVITDRGQHVDKARVWAEKNYSGKKDLYFCQIQYEDEDPIGMHGTLSDSNGFFSLKIPVNQPLYGIKAATKMYQPAVAGIFTPNNPPPEFLELVLKTEGSRMVGSITNQDGLPVEKVSVDRDIEGQKGSVTCHRSIDVGIDIDEDGKYISQILYPGNYYMRFSARGYNSLSKTVTIKKDETTVVDIVLEEKENVKLMGVVLDPFTSEPIAGVLLSNLSTKVDCKMSPMTDELGQFFVCTKEYTPVNFFYPGYVTVEKYFYARDKGKKPAKIYMSQAAAVKVNVADIPIDREKGYLVELYNAANKFKSHYSKHQTITDGSITFTNIPVHASPIMANLSKRGRQFKLARSEPVKLVAGETVDIDLSLPAMGSLVVDFACPFNADDQRFAGRSKDNMFRIDNDFECKIESKSLTWSELVTNQYKISFSIRNKSILKTNIIIRANETTKLFVDYKTNNYAKIFGITKFEDSTPFRASILAYAENSKERQIVRTADANFIVDNLDPDQTYNLQIQLAHECIGKTNLVFKNVKPSSELLELSLGPAYKIYGNIIDADGQPVKVKVSNLHIPHSGFFEIYPVLPGKHIIKFSAKGYAPIEKEVIIYGKDQDLGDIYLYGCDVKK